MNYIFGSSMSAVRVTFALQVDPVELTIAIIAFVIIAFCHWQCICYGRCEAKGEQIQS